MGPPQVLTSAAVETESVTATPASDVGTAPSVVASDAWSHPVTLTSPSGTSRARASSGEATQPRTTGSTGAPDSDSQDAPPVPSSDTRIGVRTRYPVRPSRARPDTSVCPGSSYVPVAQT